MAKSVDQLREKIVPLYDPELLKSVGVPESEIEYMKDYIVLPIDLLVKEDWNYKKDNEEMSKKLRANIKRIGQVENIHVRELTTGYFAIVNGNHRYDDMKELGKKFVVAFNHGKVPYAQAVRLAVETNETRFETDIVELAMRISEVTDNINIDDLVPTMPYTKDELEELIEMSTFDFDKHVPPPTGDDSDPTVKTVSFDLPRQVYDKWLAVRKKIEAGKVVNRERIFEFMVTVANSLTKDQVKKFHKKIDSNGTQEKTKKVKKD